MGKRHKKGLKKPHRDHVVSSDNDDDSEDSGDVDASSASDASDDDSGSSSDSEMDLDERGSHIDSIAVQTPHVRGVSDKVSDDRRLGIATHTPHVTSQRNQGSSAPRRKRSVGATRASKPSKHRSRDKDSKSRSDVRVADLLEEDLLRGGNRCYQELRERYTSLKAKYKVLKEQNDIVSSALPEIAVLSNLKASPRRDDYKQIKIWTHQEYKKVVKDREEKNGIASADQTAGSKGGTRKAAGVNVRMDWIEDEEGNPISSYVAGAMRNTAKRCWTQLALEGCLPSKWSEAGQAVMEYFRLKMYEEYPYLRYCEAHWKADQIWIQTFSGFKTNSGAFASTSNSGEGDIDEGEGGGDKAQTTQVDAEPLPTNKKRKRTVDPSKVSKKRTKKTASQIPANEGNAMGDCNMTDVRDDIPLVTDEQLSTLISFPSQTVPQHAIASAAAPPAIVGTEAKSGSAIAGQSTPAVSAVALSNGAPAVTVSANMGESSASSVATAVATTAHTAEPESAPASSANATSSTPGASASGAPSKDDTAMTAFTHTGQTPATPASIPVSSAEPTKDGTVAMASANTGHSPPAASESPGQSTPATVASAAAANADTTVSASAHTGQSIPAVSPPVFAASPSSAAAAATVSSNAVQSTTVSASNAATTAITVSAHTGQSTPAASPPVSSGSPSNGAAATVSANAVGSTLAPASDATAAIIVPAYTGQLTSVTTAPATSSNADTAMAQSAHTGQSITPASSPVSSAPFNGVAATPSAPLGLFLSNPLVGLFGQPTLTNTASASAGTADPSSASATSSPSGGDTAPSRSMDGPATAAPLGPSASINVSSATTGTETETDQSKPMRPSNTTFTDRNMYAKWYCSQNPGVSVNTFKKHWATVQPDVKAEYKQKGVEEKARREKENEAKEADGPPAVRKQPKPRPVNRK